MCLQVNACLNISLGEQKKKAEADQGAHRTEK